MSPHQGRCQLHRNGVRQFDGLAAHLLDRFRLHAAKRGEPTADRSESLRGDRFGMSANLGDTGGMARGMALLSSGFELFLGPCRHRPSIGSSGALAGTSLEGVFE
jgi:hypothetical protein